MTSTITILILTIISLVAQFACALNDNNDEDFLFVENVTNNTTAAPEQKKHHSLWNKESIGAMVGGITGVIGVLVVIVVMKTTKWGKPQNTRLAGEYQQVK